MSARAEAFPEIPDVVIRRLPIYARLLDDLSLQGVTTISSTEFAMRIGVTAAQIRRDLSYFGRFGKQGKGYEIRSLANEIRRILNLGRGWDVALVGFGYLGQAIARYRGFRESNFTIAAIFDGDPAKVGQAAGPGGVAVLSDDRIVDVVRARQIRIGIIAAPASAAQQGADRLIEGRVTAILNYAPVVLQVPPRICVRDIDPISILQSMTYYLDKPFRPHLSPHDASAQ